MQAAPTVLLHRITSSNGWLHCSRLRLVRDHHARPASSQPLGDRNRIITAPLVALNSPSDPQAIPGCAEPW